MKSQYPLSRIGISSLAGSILLLYMTDSLWTNAAAKDITPAPAFTADQLQALPRAGWITNGGNIYNQRYSPLTAINRDTVQNLKAKWHTKLGGSGTGSKYSGQGQPLIHAGVLYLPTGANDVFALDIESGAILWSYQANLDPEINVICCGWMSRGIAIGDGRVYVGQLDGKLVALDQKTGKPVWSIQAERWQDGFSITAAPLYYNGMVITGFAGADRGTRGRLRAFDASDGSPRWVFYTIPGPGEFGHDSWPQDNDAWKFGGASIWQTPAVDPELGLLYFSTGNAGPDLNGSVRAGDNLFSASIVALDVATGTYRWHFQQVHHDIWDYDSPNPVVLFDVEINGTPRKALAEVSKTGWIYILDRSNGKPLLGIEERPVPQEPRQHTAATQPYPLGEPIAPQYIDMSPEGYHLVNEGRIFTPFWTTPVVAKPAAFGAVNHPPSSYDPETHTFYACGIDSAGVFTSDPNTSRTPTPGERYVGGEFGRPGMRSRGVFAAMDLKTNRPLWRQQWQDICYSGSIVTAGGLLFVGRSDGRMTALDKTNGDKLWEFQTEAGIHSPASTFEHAGKQYVALYSAGSFVPGTKRGDSVWLFSLDGTIGPSAPFATEPVGPRPQVATGDPDTANGKLVYQQTCLPCHGEDGHGGHGTGASLEQTSRDYRAVGSIVIAGQNDMPAFDMILTPEQIRDVSAYIVRELL